MALHKEEDRIFMLEVIDLYKNLTPLWKTKDEEYSNRTKKDEAYTMLLEKYQERYQDATMHDLKKKLNSLRTNFRKELKKVNDYINYEPNLWYFNSMRFLGNQEMLSLPTTKIEWDEPEQIEEVQNDVYYRPEANQQQIKTPKLAKNIVTTELGKRKHVDKDDTHDELTFMACTHLRQLEDNSLNLAKTWANELSQMHPQQQLFAKKAINDILFEGQCGNLRRESVQINITPHSSRSCTSCGHLPYGSHSAQLMSPSPATSFLDTSSGSGCAPSVQYTTNSGHPHLYQPYKNKTNPLKNSSISMHLVRPNSN